ncbi:hypothetical protein HMPREF1624_01474 [Sporothrix schenckii ATCC 58251]|uniref:Serine-threonine protein kinase 19 n=1 Tax=Sporothrix schenckii (strain ATCC 58251 / de Perez 2211183) TaxID=1391915 RepID=U7Q5K0_SPOS1|nr:hypothetical protein HMPREF1624_01474 [Sporothrix schenckii ATCC 58251]
MSLRAILSGSRVKKRSAPVAANKTGSTKKKAALASTSTKASSPLPNNVRQAKPGRGRGSISKSATPVDENMDEGGIGNEDEDDDDNDDDDFFSDDDEQLDDNGLVASLADDLSLRDVVQALRYARGNMFEPVPQGARASAAGHADSDNNNGSTPGGARTTTGFVGNSTRTAELLNMRRRMPALATTAHVAALLPNATATERETVALIRAGVLRKVVQPQWRRGFSGQPNFGDRGGDANALSADPKRGSRALVIGGESLGEVLVETAELQARVRQGPSSTGLSDDTKEAFVAWLGDANPSFPPTPADPAAKRFTINGHPAPQLAVHMVDELVRAGFLVGHGASAGLIGSMSVTGHRSAAVGGGSNGSSSLHSGGGSRRGERGSQSDTGDVYARPEDRTTLLSLETVARAASGSFDAVGGVGAVYTAGGGGARGRYRAAAAGGGPAAAPTEDLLLSIPGHGSFVKLVSGALSYLIGIIARSSHRETLETSLRERWDAGGSIAKRREMGGGFKRVPLTRTKKWKDFYGLSFDWVLAEAVGAGLVELFDTGSVGRGVRLLS